MSKMVTREISLQEKWEGLQAISSFKTTRSILNFDVFWSLIESHNPDVFFRGKWCGLINTKVSWVNLTGLCKINSVGSCAVFSKALSGITLRQSIVAQNYSIFKGKKYIFCERSRLTLEDTADLSLSIRTFWDIRQRSAMATILPPFPVFEAVPVINHFSATNVIFDIFIQQV